MGEKFKFHVLEVFQRGISIELENEFPYEAEHPYEVWVNGELQGKHQKNVISIHGFLPDKDYEIKVIYEGESHVEKVHTKAEKVLLNVKLFGAKGDGVSDDTESLQAAISACPENGTVYLPEGIYWSKPLYLKSHINLWLEEGATLLGSPKREDYPVLPGIIRHEGDFDQEMNYGSWEGNPLDCYASLLTGIDVSDVDITGQGVINGNAAEGDWWEDAKIRRGAWRPRTIFLNGCSNIRFQGVTVHNSPSWTIHPYYCDHITFLNVKVKNPSNSPNTDGIDPESCTDVKLLGVQISVGDDCIALKSGKYYMSRAHHKRTRQVLVRNCLLESGHGSVTIGSEISSGVEDVHVTNCIFRGTDRGIRIKTRRGRGDLSVVDQLFFENISMQQVHMPLTVGMFYFCDPDGHSDYVQNQEYRPVDERTPEIGTISVKNVTCEGVDESFICMYGLPERKIRKVELEDVNVSFLPENERRYGTPLMMDGFQEMSGNGIYLHNVAEVSMKNVSIAGSVNLEPTMLQVDHSEIQNLIFK